MKETVLAGWFPFSEEGNAYLESSRTELTGTHTTDVSDACSLLLHTLLFRGMYIDLPQSIHYFERIESRMFPPFQITLSAQIYQALSLVSPFPFLSLFPSEINLSSLRVNMISCQTFEKHDISCQTFEKVKLEFKLIIHMETQFNLTILSDLPSPGRADRKDTHLAGVRKGKNRSLTKT